MTSGETPNLVSMTSGETPYYLMFECNTRLSDYTWYSLPAENFASQGQYCQQLRKRLAESYKKVCGYVQRQQQHQKQVYAVAWWPGGAWGPRPPPLRAKIMGRHNTKGRQ